MSLTTLVRDRKGRRMPCYSDIVREMGQILDALRYVGHSYKSADPERELYLDLKKRRWIVEDVDGSVAFVNPD